MNTTRTFPRTLEQAFGPYERGGLYVAPEPMHTSDRIVVAASALGAVALLIALIFN